MWLTGKLPVQPLVAAALLVCLVGCSAATPAQSEDRSPEPTAKLSWDPLAIPEPEISPPPKGPPTEKQMLAFLDYVGAAYTYSLRTGFLQSLLEVVPESCGCRFWEDVSKLADAGLHADMDEVSMRVLKSGSVKPVREGTWSLPVLVEMSIPKRVVADASGHEVRVEPAETRRAEVFLLSDLGEWSMYGWNEVREPAA